MMIVPAGVKVHVALGYTDMRIMRSARLCRVRGGMLRPPRLFS